MIKRVAHTKGKSFLRWIKSKRRLIDYVEDEKLKEESQI